MHFPFLINPVQISLECNIYLIFGTVGIYLHHIEFKPHSSLTPFIFKLPKLFDVEINKLSVHYSLMLLVSHTKLNKCEILARFNYICNTVLYNNNNYTIKELDVLKL